MNTTPDNIEELIAMYLAGEALPDQVAVIERWRQASDENRRHFDQVKLIFEKSGPSNETILFDTDEAWNRISKSLLTRKKTILMRPDATRFSLLKIAAGILVFIAAGVFAYQFFSDGRIQSGEVLASDEARLDTLPDGSAVFLNRQTRIEYTHNKRGDRHVAKLSGEAYFDIHHQDNKDFIVQAGETFIKDIGTSFNVKAYPDSGIVEVLVESGEVLFYTENDDGVHLRANDRGSYNKKTGKFTVGAPRPNTTSYKTRSFTFNNHSLETVVKTLNSVYGTKVRIDDRLKNCKLTVSFNEERIEEIVHVIAETHGLKVANEGDEIWLRGTGCGEAPSK